MAHENNINIPLGLKHRPGSLKIIPALFSPIANGFLHSPILSQGIYFSINNITIFGNDTIAPPHYLPSLFTPGIEAEDGKNAVDGDDVSE